MKAISVVAVLLLVAAVVEAETVGRDFDPDGFDDEADFEEVIGVDGGFMVDDDGNVVEIWDEPDDETIEETVAAMAERVFFHLYTRKNPTVSQMLAVDDVEALANSNWDPSKLTRILVHGWISSHESDYCIVVRDAYLENGDHNIIVLDWSPIAKRSYGFAFRRVKVVAAYIAKFIDFLENQGVDISELVVVGHSLGGHVAGLSALQATNTVGTVVSLDPAGPYFWLAGPGNRVDKGDAAHVEVIHTNGGMLGLHRAVGDIDFYPNGGQTQPGCIIDAAGICSHGRAFRFFAESLNTERGFWGLLCNSWRRYRYGFCRGSTTAIMGGNVLSKIPEPGSYWFRTASFPKFALGPI